MTNPPKGEDAHISAKTKNTNRKFHVSFIGWFFIHIKAHKMRKTDKKPQKIFLRIQDIAGFPKKPHKQPME